MKIAYVTLSQMLVLFTLILLGFILRKTKILPENSDSVMSRLEMYIFVPALSLSTWIKKCDVKTFSENSNLILYGLICMLAAIIISYPLSAIFVRKTKNNPESVYQRNIYKYAMAFSNYGFMGNAIVLGIWGSNMFFKYSMFTFFISVFCYSWGIYILMPKDENKKAAPLSFLKRLMIPPMLALPIGMVGGFLGVKYNMPGFVMTVLENASSCMGPVAMLLAGFVIGGYNVKEMLTNKKVYIAAIMRLIIIPAIMLSVLKLFGVSEEILILVLVAFASPLGLNTIVYPANYGCDTKTGASMTMISSTLSVATIPLMYLMFIA